MAWFQLGPPNPWLMPVKPPMEPPRFKKVNGLFVQVHKDGQWDTNRHRPSKETAMNTIH
jgi:hypothetical protein